MCLWFLSSFLFNYFHLFTVSVYIICIGHSQKNILYPIFFYFCSHTTSSGRFCPTCSIYPANTCLHTELRNPRVCWNTQPNRRIMQCMCGLERIINWKLTEPARTEMLFKAGSHVTTHFSLLSAAKHPYVPVQIMITSSHISIIWTVYYFWLAYHNFFVSFF